MDLHAEITSARHRRRELAAIELAQEAAAGDAGVAGIMAAVAALYPEADITVAEAEHARVIMQTLGLDLLPPGEALALAGELIPAACRQLG